MSCEAGDGATVCGDVTTMNLPMENTFKHGVLGKLIGDLLLPLQGLSHLGWISTLSIPLPITPWTPF